MLHESRPAAPSFAAHGSSALGGPKRPPFTQRGDRQSHRAAASARDVGRTDAWAVPPAAQTRAPPRLDAAQRAPTRPHDAPEAARVHAVFRAPPPSAKAYDHVRPGATRLYPTCRYRYRALPRSAKIPTKMAPPAVDLMSAPARRARPPTAIADAAHPTTGAARGGNTFPSRGLKAGSHRSRNQLPPGPPRRWRAGPAAHHGNPSANFTTASSTRSSSTRSSSTRPTRPSLLSNEAPSHRPAGTMHRYPPQG